MKIEIELSGKQKQDIKNSLKAQISELGYKVKNCLTRGQDDFMINHINKMNRQIDALDTLLKQL